MFPPQYGYLEETEYDSLDFRKPHEMGVKKYSLLTDPRGDIDRTKGYDPSTYTVAPDVSLLDNPRYKVQVTWIRHASFLIQLGRKYQILIDPVIEEIDGLVGKLGKYFEIGTLYAKSPLATEDLPFARESETPRENQTVIVAISHDHYDHLNYNTLRKPYETYSKNTNPQDKQKTTLGHLRRIGSSLKAICHSFRSVKNFIGIRFNSAFHYLAMIIH